MSVQEPLNRFVVLPCCQCRQAPPKRHAPCSCRCRKSELAQGPLAVALPTDGNCRPLLAACKPCLHACIHFSIVLRTNIVTNFLHNNRELGCQEPRTGEGSQRSTPVLYCSRLLTALLHYAASLHAHQTLRFSVLCFVALATTFSSTGNPLRLRTASISRRARLAGPAASVPHSSSSSSVVGTKNGSTYKA